VGFAVNGLVTGFPNDEEFSPDCHYHRGSPFWAIIFGILAAYFMEILCLFGRPLAIADLSPSKLRLFIDQEKEYFIVEGWLVLLISEQVVKAVDKQC
jgi:hypothetical protein